MQRSATIYIRSEYFIHQGRIEAGYLADSIVNELVSDVTNELQRQTVNNVADRKSAYLRDAPSIEVLLHRLKQIEVG